MANEKIALIGYGYWGQIVIRYLQKSRDFDLSYVYGRSLDNEERTRLSAKFETTFTGELDEIWTDKSVRNVLIATPVKTHYPLVRIALEYSKNVLAEKPLAQLTSEVNHIAELARSGRCKVLTDFIYNFSPGLHKAKQLMETGAIGDLQAMHLCLKQLGRFMAYDVYTVLGSHCLAILDIFYPIRTLAFQKQDLMWTNNLVSSAVLRFQARDSSFNGIIDVGMNYPLREKKVVLYGSEGTLIFDPLTVNTLKSVRFSSEKKKMPSELIRERNNHTFDESNNIRFLIESFHKMVTADHPDNLDRALAVTEILESVSHH